MRPMIGNYLAADMEEEEEEDNEEEEVGKMAPPAGIDVDLDGVDPFYDLSVPPLPSLPFDHPHPYRRHTKLADADADAKLAEADFFNSFEDDFDDSDIL